MGRVLVCDILNVTLFDSADSVLISGTQRQDVELVIRELLKFGARLIRKPEALGSNWTASCQRAESTADVEVEPLGRLTLIRGRKFEAVQAEVNEYTERGYRLDREIEHLNGYYIAACVGTSMEPTWVQCSLW